MNGNKAGAIIYLEIVDGPPNEATMRRISKVPNIYNPDKNTYPCYHLKRRLYYKGLKRNQILQYMPGIEIGAHSQQKYISFT
jgi:hypothetical protein